MLAAFLPHVTLESMFHVRPVVLPLPPPSHTHTQVLTTPMPKMPTGPNFKFSRQSETGGLTGL